jgi:hypothetical protein
LVGAALAATLTSSKMGGSGLWGAASSVAFGILKAGSGRKPLLPTKDDVVLVGAALAATLAPPKAQGSGLQGAAFIRGLWDLEGRGSGRKPLLPKRTMCLGRSGFSRDPCVIEGGRFGIVGDGPSSVALGILKAGSGLKLLLQKAFCRSGFSRDPCATEGARLWATGDGLHPWPSGSRRQEVRG